MILKRSVKHAIDSAVQMPVELDIFIWLFEVMEVNF